MIDFFSNTPKQWTVQKVITASTSSLLPKFKVVRVEATNSDTQVAIFDIANMSGGSTPANMSGGSTPKSYAIKYKNREETSQTSLSVKKIIHTTNIEFNVGTTFDTEHRKTHTFFLNRLMHADSDTSARSLLEKIKTEVDKDNIEIDNDSKNNIGNAIKMTKTLRLPHQYLAYLLMGLYIQSGTGSSDNPSGTESSDQPNQNGNGTRRKRGGVGLETITTVFVYVLVVETIIWIRCFREEQEKARENTGMNNEELRGYRHACYKGSSVLVHIFKVLWSIITFLIGPFLPKRPPHNFYDSSEVSLPI